MKQVKKMCFDKILPRDLRRIQRLVEVVDGQGLSRPQAVAVANKRWTNGKTIKICFLEGSLKQIEMVKEISVKWTEHANLTFEFVEEIIDSDIRVSFDPYDGAWSYMGTDNLEISKPNATLNLGWLDEHVILHEFGHMIGLAHEHQNPEGGIEWNEEAVISEFSSAPNYWTEDVIRHNILMKYSRDITVGTVFDPDSIMLYHFSADLTSNNFSTQQNETFSKNDKEFIRSSKMYPPTVIKYPKLHLDEIINASISKEGEEDIYLFTVEETGIYTIQTMGEVDMYMHLYDAKTDEHIMTDDDSGNNTNAKIEVELERGEYTVQLQHYYPSEHDKYKISVVKL